jgi:membrane associated rhomboid family serine protease
MATFHSLVPILSTRWGFLLEYICLGLGGGSFTIRRVGVFMFSEENSSESIMASVVLSGIFGAAKMRESLERKVVCRLTLPVLPFLRAGKRK